MRPFFTPVTRATSRVAGLALMTAALVGTTRLGAQSTGNDKPAAKSPPTTAAKSGSKTSAKHPTKPQGKSATSGTKGKATKKGKKTEKDVSSPLPKNRYTADTISVGATTATRNSRVSGTFDAAPTNGSTHRIPFALIHGANPGPVVAYLSQAPDSGYSTVAGLMKLVNLIDPAKVSGSIIVVPWFDASATPAVLAQIVERADLVVALSGQPIDDDLHPYGYWPRTGNPTQDKASGALAVAFGLDVVAVRDVTLPTTARNDDLVSATLAAGKSVLRIEGGRASAAAASATNSVVAGCLNVLGSIGVITRAVGMNGKVSWIGASHEVHAASNGAFSPEVERGAKVRKGQKIGALTDGPSAVAADILSPTDGIVTFIRSSPSVAKDATILIVATNYGPTPPPFSKPKP